MSCFFPALLPWLMKPFHLGRQKKILMIGSILDNYVTAEHLSGAEGDNMKASIKCFCIQNKSHGGGKMASGLRLLNVYQFSLIFKPEWLTKQMHSPFFPCQVRSFKVQAGWFNWFWRFTQSRISCNYNNEIGANIVCLLASRRQVITTPLKRDVIQKMTCQGISRPIKGVGNINQQQA